MTAKKTKPHLVLLHGLGGSSADWADAAKLLAKTYDVLAFDLPGADGAPKPSQDYAPASLARAVSARMKADGIASAFVAGHSLGGRVAGELLVLEPARVEALALVAPLGAAAYSLTEKLKWKAMSRRAVLESVPESSMRSASGYGFVSDGPAKKAFVERTLSARTGPNAATVFSAVEKSVDGVLDAPPLSDRLRGTKAPLLVVVGARDPLVSPESGRAILKARPDAKFLELPRAGHYPMLEDPAGIADAFKDFFG